jgi:hypothetical protein
VIKSLLMLLVAGAIAVALTYHPAKQQQATTPHLRYDAYHHGLWEYGYYAWARYNVCAVQNYGGAKLQNCLCLVDWYANHVTQAYYDRFLAYVSQYGSGPSWNDQNAMNAGGSCP